MMVNAKINSALTDDITKIKLPSTDVPVGTTLTNEGTGSTCGSPDVNNPVISAPSGTLPPALLAVIELKFGYLQRNMVHFF